MNASELVNVYEPYRLFADNKWEPARVNWAAAGAVDPKIAIEFANAVLEAAGKAMAMNLAIKEDA